jgi:hypothetical protein
VPIIVKPIGVAALAVITFVIVAFALTFALRVHHFTAAFSQVAVGDSEASVVARLGEPSFRERAGQPYLRYTGTPCTTPCATRLWWEWPIMPGIKAWSVELGENRDVVRTYRWKSP